LTLPPSSSQARTSDDLTLLPLLEPEIPRERADAARNRARILEAAGALVAEQGIEAMSMEAVAKAACVGTGTLYRRFGDRSGLAFALLDEQTRDFQNALISGPPPLGPGAPAHERLHAFGRGYLDLLERHSALMTAAEHARGEKSGAPLSVYATHLAILLREAAPLVDPQFTAEALLATLSPQHHLRMRHGLGWSLERVRAGWCGLIDALTGAARGTP
jgi:AcrR family transcriptional regulator